MPREDGLCTAKPTFMPKTQPGVTWCYSMNIFTAITAVALAPAIRPGGRRWLPSCSKSVPRGKDGSGQWGLKVCGAPFPAAVQAGLISSQANVAVNPAALGLQAY